MPDLISSLADLWFLIPSGYFWAVGGSVTVEFVSVANYARRNRGRFPERYSSTSYCLFMIAFHLFVPGTVALAIVPQLTAPHEATDRAFFIAGAATPCIIGPFLGSRRNHLDE